MIFRNLPTWRGIVIYSEMEINPPMLLACLSQSMHKVGVPGAKARVPGFWPGDFKLDDLSAHVMSYDIFERFSSNQILFYGN
ncbi:hypothetical protein RchiOBHm_Chr2g0121301 [Rosa chinensis]|uniref:Uncharacterized protein n=1 Tax=Rosa chinensis TaxID=74649 RepID=A0A2P6RSJ3_ROSCH|nr:hypothetical protein RchiOBHm_Chr2g0121301 [Rosa chinensis]